MNAPNDPDLIVITNWNRSKKDDEREIEEEIKRLEKCRANAIGCVSIIVALCAALVYAVFFA